MPDLPDHRQYAPATQRNREAILKVLLKVLPPIGAVLEISSGTGEHAIFFAPQLYPRQWIPSDANPLAIASITAWQEHYPASNLLPAISLDACDPVWEINCPHEPIVAIANINMIHIAPWSACLGLMAGAKRILPQGGILYLYGPFKQGGQHTSLGNLTFDQSLRAQNPEWGVRDLDEVIKVAKAQGLAIVETVDMPANNLSVVFQAKD